MSARWLIRVLALSLLLASGGRAHIVTEIPAKAFVEGEMIVVEILADLGFSTNEPLDPGAPQPTREVLFQMSEAEHETARANLGYFCRNALHFFDANGSMLDSRVTFPGYDRQPPEFPEMVSGGAYITVRMTVSSPSQGIVTLRHADPRSPYFWIEAKKPGQFIPAFIHLYPGASAALPFEMGADPGPDVADDPRWSYFMEFLHHGYRHVIPDGWDHILFVLALCLLSLNARTLLHQTLVFTLAHSITLGLSVAGWIMSFPKVVEPLIALSIAWMAAENLIARKSGKSRLLMIFVFGLIHGMGFGSMLARKIQDSGMFGLALFAANLGVELAQVTVIAGVLLVAWRFRETKAFERSRIAASVGIGVCGLWLFVQRVS